MTALKKHPAFKIAAVILGIFILIFAAHFISHLGHGMDERMPCYVCKTLSTFALLLVLAVCPARALCRASAYYIGTSAPPQDFFTASVQVRAPPVLS